jgi:prepilin-type N-terminal cleavage/methylation domain-containing protein
MFYKDINPQKGFTIIELIVVIVIIAVLAAVIMASVNQYIKSSKVSALKAEMQTVYKLAVNYYSANGDYQSVCSGTQIGTVNTYINKLDPSQTNECRDNDLHGGGPTCSRYQWYFETGIGSSAPLGRFCVDYTGHIVDAPYGALKPECCCIGNLVDGSHCP